MPKRTMCGQKVMNIIQPIDRSPETSLLLKSRNDDKDWKQAVGVDLSLGQKALVQRPEDSWRHQMARIDLKFVYSKRNHKLGHD